MIHTGKIRSGDLDFQGKSVHSIDCFRFRGMTYRRYIKEIFYRSHRVNSVTFQRHIHS